VLRIQFGKKALGVKIIDQRIVLASLKPGSQPLKLQFICFEATQSSTNRFTDRILVDSPLFCNTTSAYAYGGEFNHWNKYRVLQLIFG